MVGGYLARRLLAGLDVDPLTTESPIDPIPPPPPALRLPPPPPIPGRAERHCATLTFKYLNANEINEWNN